MKATASTEATAHTIMISGIGIGPVRPMAETLLVSHPGTAPLVAPLLHSSATPDTARLMPKLVIREWTCRSTDDTALIVPMTIASAAIARKMTGSDQCL